MSYKDIDDTSVIKKPVVASISETLPDSSTSIAESPQQDNADTTDSTPGTSEKSSFSNEEHPVFVYRCFLLHCLTELLYSYNQTKIEFISFTRKPDVAVATPSKAKSSVLTYMLNNLVSSGYVDPDDTTICAKKLVTSGWAKKVVVALCTKTGETDLLTGMSSRHPQQIDDRNNESDLIYIRKFVLDHAIRVFKDALSSQEATQTKEATQVRYARILCLSDLFHRMLTKPTSGTDDGTAGVHNNSYKRMLRLAFEKNLIAVLTSAVSDIDLSYSGARRVVKYVLRPLQELTSMAAQLSMHSPESLPVIIEQASNDDLSDASSDVSNVEDEHEREETPDFYRNSSLGFRDTNTHNNHDESDAEELEDGDADMDYDEGYEDEDIVYDNGLAPGGQDEVVSDEELEDIAEHEDMEGISGDVPMDEDDELSEDDESGDSEDDDDDDDDEIDEDDIEIEIEEQADEHGEHLEGEDEDGWEDEAEGEADEDDDEDDDHILEADQLDRGVLNILDPNGQRLAADILRDIDAPGVLPRMIAPVEEEEDEDDEEDADDIDENDGMGYDHTFEEMLEGRDDYDEGGWGFEEPPPGTFRRLRDARSRARGIGGPMQSFFSRRVGGDGMIYRTNHRRTAPSGRVNPDDGTNPLLQRLPTTEPNTPGSYEDIRIP
ncbi:E3 ubiquitin-protein ligase tom1, partial [Elasticomyces elasticus]